MDNNNINNITGIDVEPASSAPEIQAHIPEINEIGQINSLDDAAINDIPVLPEVETSMDKEIAADIGIAAQTVEQTAETILSPETAPAQTQNPMPGAMPLPRMRNTPDYVVGSPVSPAFADPRVQPVYPSGNIPQQIAMNSTPIILQPAMPVQKPRKGEWLALAGFLCGIVSVSLTWGSKLSYVCAVVALVGIVLAAVAAKKGVRTTMQSTGLTLSIIGLVCSIVTTVCCMAVNSCAESMAESFANSIPQDVMSDIMEGDADALAEYLQEYVESTNGMNFD